MREQVEDSEVLLAPSTGLPRAIAALMARTGLPALLADLMPGTVLARTGLAVISAGQIRAIIALSARTGLVALLADLIPGTVLARAGLAVITDVKLVESTVPSLALAGPLEILADPVAHREFLGNR
jgi:hypothetical protein